MRKAASVIRPFCGVAYDVEFVRRGGAVACRSVALVPYACGDVPAAMPAAFVAALRPDDVLATCDTLPGGHALKTLLRPSAPPDAGADPPGSDENADARMAPSVVCGTGPAKSKPYCLDPYLTPNTRAMAAQWAAECGLPADTVESTHRHYIQRLCGEVVTPRLDREREVLLEERAAAVLTERLAAYSHAAGVDKVRHFFTAHDSSTCFAMLETAFATSAGVLQQQTAACRPWVPGELLPSSPRVITGGYGDRGAVAFPQTSLETFVADDAALAAALAAAICNYRETGFLNPEPVAEGSSLDGAMMAYGDGDAPVLLRSLRRAADPSTPEVQFATAAAQATVDLTGAASFTARYGGRKRTPSLVTAVQQAEAGQPEGGPRSGLVASEANHNPLWDSQAAAVAAAFAVLCPR